MKPTTAAVLEQRHLQERADAAEFDQGVAHTGGGRQECIGRDIRGLDRLSGRNAPRDQSGVLGEWISAAPFGEGGRYAQQRHPFDALPIIRQECTERRRAQPQRPLQHRIEHRRQIAGRGVDHLQHLGGRGLLLQRLALFGDQPRVLHRDHRLGGEVLQ